MVLATGHTYMIGAAVPVLPSDPPQEVGLLALAVPDPIDFSGDTTQDINLPRLPGTTAISGLVTDSGGVGVGSTRVSASTQQVTGAQCRVSARHDHGSKWQLPLGRAEWNELHFRLLPAYTCALEAKKSVTTTVDRLQLTFKTSHRLSRPSTVNC